MSDFVLRRIVLLKCYVRASKCEVSISMNGQPVNLSVCVLVHKIRPAVQILSYGAIPRLLASEISWKLL